VGVGEKMTDLMPFDPDAFVAGLFDIEPQAEVTES
jgi:signal recognition particle GTPase